MATTIKTLQNSWDRTRCVRSGHFAAFYPGNSGQGRDNTLVLFDAAGNEVAANVDALRDFDLAIDEGTGEIFAVYCQFIDGSPRPYRRWNTGVRVPPLTAAAPPPAPANNNAAIVNQIRDLLAKIV